MTPAKQLLVCAGRVVTCDPARATPHDVLGVIEDGAVLIDGDRIRAVGTRAELLHAAPDIPVVMQAPDAVVTPGLVDAHTHLAWAGSRHDEYILRMQGAGYEAIAAAGGGIVASTRAVRAASETTLVERLQARLRRMAALGTTTCEVKSGYGLDLDSERKQLRAVATLSRIPSLPRVVPTFLPLHALPPEGRSDRARWVEQVISNWLPAIVSEGLAWFVDAYIDRNAFTPQEARGLFERAKAAGLGVRAHVGQFADVGGAALAAQVGAASADHLENVSDEALAALARAGTRAVLLPVASFTLRQSPPPVDRIRAAGVPIVIASDANPGTAPTESLPLAMALGLHTYGLTPEECLLGATREAAESLGLGDTCGQLSPTFSADLVIWDLPHERALLQPWGSPVTRWVAMRGTPLSPYEA
ncbi:MAG: imidazolonepropionase [Polyangiaceae bacterium]|nr:imidazolonepropionase [Polyangiaceae bacterium]